MTAEVSTKCTGSLASDLPSLKSRAHSYPQPSYPVRRFAVSPFLILPSQQKARDDAATKKPQSKICYDNTVAEEISRFIFAAVNV